MTNEEDSECEKEPDFKKLYDTLWARYQSLNSEVIKLRQDYEIIMSICKNNIVSRFRV